MACYDESGEYRPHLSCHQVNKAGNQFEERLCQHLAIQMASKHLPLEDQKLLEMVWADYSEQEMGDVLDLSKRGAGYRFNRLVRRLLSLLGQK